MSFRVLVAGKSAICHVVLVLFFDALPGCLPVLWLLLMPAQHIANRFGVLAPGGDARQPGLDDPARIVLEEGLCVHACYKLPAVKTITVVHQTPEFLPQFNSDIGHAGRDEPGVVRFDLVINVIGVGIEFRMP